MHKSFSCMFISILYMFQTAMCTSSAYAPAYQTVIYMIFVIFVNNQLDAQFFFMYVYFYSLHVSDSYVSIIRRINCINTTSGICHSVSTVWYAGAYAPAYQTVIYMIFVIFVNNQFDAQFLEHMLLHTRRSST